MTDSIKVKLMSNQHPKPVDNTTLTPREKVLIKTARAFSSSHDQEVDMVYCVGSGVSVRLLWSDEDMTFIMGPEVTYEEAALKRDLDEDADITPKEDLTRRFCMFDYETEMEWFEVVANNWLELSKGKDREQAIDLHHLEVIRTYLDRNVRVKFDVVNYSYYTGDKFTNERVWYEYDPKTQAFSRHSQVDNDKAEVLDRLVYNSDEYQDLGRGLNELYNWINGSRIRAAELVQAHESILHNLQSK